MLCPPQGAPTSGVGYRYLPRKDVKTVGLFGAAGQAANQLLALKCERPITHVKIYRRNPENRRKFAEKYGPMFNREAYGAFFSLRRRR
jgi:ornithine cyclodeaminase/alanine dehydrogenase-like protein (mu-crystallin family)